MKKHQRQQDRRGNPATRRLEFEIIRDQVKRRKDQFIARLSRNLVAINGCIVAVGTGDHGGYPRMNFRYKGKHHSIQVLRIIAILRNCAPIPLGYEVSHGVDECFNRACVLHTELQHYVENAATYHRRSTDEAPF